MEFIDRLSRLTADQFCDEIGRLLASNCTDTVFHTVIDIIFSFSTSTHSNSLGLRSQFPITGYLSYPASSCPSLYALLKPNGPVFHTALQLRTRKHTFTVPRSFLDPPKVYDDTTNPMAVFNRSCTTPESTVVVDSVELLCLHFFRFLVNRQTMNGLHTQRQSYLGPDSVYLALVPQYVEYFLPLDPIHTAPSSYGSQENDFTRRFVQIVSNYWLSPSIYEAVIPSVSCSTAIPSLDHAKSVRIFLKQLLYYCHMCSVKNASQQQQQHQQQQLAGRSALGAMSFSSTLKAVVGPAAPVMSVADITRKLLVEEYVKEALFNYLVYCLNHWHLDESFRLPLETWLTYVQPWRYETVGSLQGQDGSVPLDSKWCYFLNDSKCFYSVLLVHFLKRCYNCDLTSQKHAYFLFRVTKMLSYPGLSTLLKNCTTLASTSSAAATATTSTPSLQQRHRPANLFSAVSPIAGSGTTSLSTPVASGRRTSAAGTSASSLSPRQLTPDMSGDLFDEKCVNQVQMFVDWLHRKFLISGTSSTNSPSSSSSSTLGSSHSVADWLTSFSLGDSFGSKSLDGSGMNGGDGLSSIQYLQAASHNLQQVFNVKPTTRVQPSTGEASVTDHVRLVDGRYELTPTGRFQAVHRMRPYSWLFIGAPELQPVRRDESAVLVRLLFCISMLLNCTFAEKIASFVQGKDFLAYTGNHWQFLRAPVVWDASYTDNEARQRRLGVDKYSGTWYYTVFSRPHVSLRPLATYRFLLTLVVTVLVLVVFIGFGFLLAVPLSGLLLAGVALLWSSIWYLLGTDRDDVFRDKSWIRVH